MTPERQTNARTRKYLDRQASILRAAVGILNQKGLRDMTLGEVAEHFGLVPTGVAYYFRSKEILAAACFHQAIEVHRDLIRQAASGATFTDRLGALVRSYFDLLRRISLGDAPDFALFEDVRSLNDPVLERAYVDMFREARALFDSGMAVTGDRAALNARVHLLIQQLVWSRYWLANYDPQDYARAAERTLDILLNGLGETGAGWSPTPLDMPQGSLSGEDGAREVFLRAATQLINEQGYRGASVDRIAARLDVTKGSFYYHIDAKDDLIEVCYLRTVEVMRRAQYAAGQLPRNGRDRLASTLAHLLDHQIRGDAPLLRFLTASVPEAIKRKLQIGCERVSIHFGSMVSDGIADGSLRAIDAQIAAQMLMAASIAGAELTNWLPGPPDGRTIESFVRPLFVGLALSLPPAA